MGILVVGSFVTDFVARTERAPVAGETVTGLSFDTFMGERALIRLLRHGAWAVRSP